jgi:hypothetical protein
MYLLWLSVFVTKAKTRIEVSMLQARRHPIILLEIKMEKSNVFGYALFCILFWICCLFGAEVSIYILLHDPHSYGIYVTIRVWDTSTIGIQI